MTMTGEEYFVQRRAHMKRLLAEHQAATPPRGRKHVLIEDIEKLRAFTGAGPAYCKMALEKNTGSLEAAAMWLREQIGKTVWA